MRPIADLPDAVCARLLGVFTDIDDTLTTEGRLPADAYAALERLHAAGLSVVPITGRPAGWCDLIARLWPVAGVVGENGAFFFAYDGGNRRMIRRFEQDAATRAEGQRRLHALRERILRAVPGSAVAADQLYREADLAIDFREDVPALPAEAVDSIVALFEEAGATAKVSSIHVNGWFGSYDKLSMARVFARDILGVDLEAERERFVFCGDSPNDAPLFGFFPHSCGVANVLAFRGRLAAEPAYVAGREGGAGFVEIAERILDGRERAATVPRARLHG